MKIFGKEFSGQELILGAFANAILIWVAPGDIAVPVVAASSALWMLGGTFWKPLRRFGVPAAPVIGMLTMLRPEACTWYFVAAVLGTISLHIGDGFPDHRPTTSDKGSWLGRAVERILPAPEIGGPATKILACAIYIATTVLYWL